MLSRNRATKNKCRAFGPEKLDRENLSELLECIRILAPYIASWVFCLKKVSNQLSFQQIRQINPDKAYFLSRTLCLLIPNQCSRYFLAINNTPVGACDLNPLSSYLIAIRIKAQEYLETLKCNIPNGPESNYLPDVAVSITQAFPIIVQACQIQKICY